MIYFDLMTYRKRHKLTQVDVSEMLGMTQSALSKMERKCDRINVSTINKIADRLGCDALELIGSDSKGVWVQHG